MSDTAKEARFRLFVRDLLERGIKPTPSAVMARQGEERFAYQGGRDGGGYLSGSLSTIRIEEFERAGWTMGHNGKWRKP